MELAKGCCSASLPCNHQKAHPESLCEICQQVAFTLAASADEEKHGGDCNAGALSADPHED